MTRARAPRFSSLALGVGALVLAATGAGCSVKIGLPDSLRTVPGGDASSSEDCSRAGGSYEREQCSKEEELRKDWAKKQAAFDAAFADELAAFQDMQPALKDADVATPELAEKAEALRARFVRRCIEESGWSTSACWNGTFARDITLALAKIRFRQHDYVGAAIEAWTFKHDHDLRGPGAKLAVLDGKNDPCHWDSSGKWCHAVERIVGGTRVQTSPGTEENLDDEALGIDGHVIEDEVEWKSSSDVVGMSKSKSQVVFSFRAQGGNADTERSCGDVEWRQDRAGNDVLVRPCKTEHFVTAREVFPPAVVPVADLGDYKASKDTGALIAYAKKGKHLGHAVETWVDTHEVTDRGLKILKDVLFRGIPAHEAKPGYP